MKKALVVAVMLFSAVTLRAQLYSTNFDNVPAGTLAETISTPGLRFVASPQGTWETVDASTLGFASLSGTALYEPNTVAALDVILSAPVTNVQFSFAMSTTPGNSSIVVQAFSGSTQVASVTQATTSAGAFFGEGAINLTTSSAFDKIHISAVQSNVLIAIDNLRFFGASIAVTKLPSGMVQIAGQGGATDTFSITNNGGNATTVTLQKAGPFYTLPSAPAVLNPGGTQTFTITGLPEAAGFYKDDILVSGNGVPPNTVIPVRLLSTAAPSGVPNVAPAATRVDVAATGTQNPSGTVSFKNSGTTTISGMLVADVPWIIPQNGVFVLAPGETKSASFTIDRSRRPDASAPLGSLRGSITLVLPTTASGKIEANDGPNVNLGTRVNVVDTAKPPVAAATIPALGQGELALFVPGVGHVAGSVGTFISDVNFGNAADLFSISGIRLYYVPTGTTTPNVSSSTISTILPSQGVNLADIVKTVYGNDAQVGSLQIRGTSLEKLAVSANIFNSSNPTGTFGTAIPVMRSDRAAGVGEKTYLAGLLKDGTHHTNLFMQETSGAATSVRTDFLDNTGRIIASRNDTVQPFNLLQITDPLPAGAVSAQLTNTAGGKFLAYATPVDRASGDTWAVADWNRLNAFGGAASVLVPVAGAVHGANNTYFRTDISIMNTGSGSSSGTLRYITNSGINDQRIITLRALESYNIADVVTNVFELKTDTVGYLTWTPTTTSSSFLVTSHTYTTVQGSAATFGTGVPTLALSASLKKGQSKIIGALSDASNATIGARVPATFRSNVGLVETVGAPVTVRLTLLGGDGRSLAFGTLASKTMTMTARQYLAVNQIGAALLGDARSAYGDLVGAAIRVDVLDGAGGVAIYTSSIDNGTGDSILRTE